MSPEINLDPLISTPELKSVVGDLRLFCETWQPADPTRRQMFITELKFLMTRYAHAIYSPDNAPAPEVVDAIIDARNAIKAKKGILSESADLVREDRER